MKTLIAYATKRGSTEKCAQMLAEKLTGDVELCNLKEGQTVDLNQYDRVIIGGSIYAGQMRKEVKEFCGQNLTQLQQKKLGLFICNMDPKNVDLNIENAFPAELREQAIAKESLGGEFNFTKMNFLERFVIKMISKKQSGEKIDTKQDVSNLSLENLERFAQLMNAA